MEFEFVIDDVEDGVCILVFGIWSVVVWVYVVVLFVGEDDFVVGVVECCWVLVGEVFVDYCVELYWVYWVGDVE